MRVHEFADAHHFLERARDFFNRDERRHSLLYSSALSLAKVHARPSASLVFLATEDGAAARSPNHRWIVDSTNQEAARALAEKIGSVEKQIDRPLRSLMVPTEMRGPFSGDCPDAPTQNFMSLTRPIDLDPSEGLFRFALPKDLKTLIQWSKGFASESRLDETAQEAEDVVQKYFDTKQLFVWENHSKLVSMAAIGGFTPKSARISMVYSDPSHRGRGYASTLVHRVSHRLFQDGKTATLFADTRNHQTRHIYEKLGFRTLSEWTELKPVHLRSPGSKVTMTG